MRYTGNKSKQKDSKRLLAHDSKGIAIVEWLV